MGMGNIKTTLEILLEDEFKNNPPQSQYEYKAHISSRLDLVEIIMVDMVATTLAMCGYGEEEKAIGALCRAINHGVPVLLDHMTKKALRYAKDDKEPLSHAH